MLLESTERGMRLQQCTGTAADDVASVEQHIQPLEYLEHVPDDC